MASNLAAVLWKPRVELLGVGKTTSVAVEQKKMKCQIDDFLMLNEISVKINLVLLYLLSLVCVHEVESFTRVVAALV